MINASDIYKLKKEITTKVEKVTGKGLSSNDYTNLDKEKLKNLENVDLSNYYTKGEVYNKIEVDSEINKIKLLTTGHKSIIDKDSWNINPSSHLFECIICHNLDIPIESLNISFYVNTDCVMLDYSYIDRNNVKIYSRDNVETVVVIKYMTSGSIPATKEEVDAIKSEIIKAKKDYFGKVHNSLQDRLINDYTSSVINKEEKNYLEFTSNSDGVVVADNSFEGAVSDLSLFGNTKYLKFGDIASTVNSSSITVKNDKLLEAPILDLTIHGKTIGGYDTETSTSSALASVGQAEGNKISILSAGKNLYPYITDGSYTDIKLTWTQVDGVLNGTGEELLNSPYKIRLAKGSYYISCTTTNIVQLVNTAGTKVIAINKKVEIIDTDDYVIRFRKSEDGGIVNFKDIQIEIGDVKTPYEPYKSDKKDILLPFDGGLKGVGVGSEDIVELSRITQKCNKFNLLDIIDTYFHSFVKLTTVCRLSIRVPDSIIKSYGINTRCNMFKQLAGYELDEEHYYADNKVFNFYIELSKLPTQNKEGVKKWLETNIVEVVYELETPIIHEIAPVGKLSTFRALTTISISSGVTPSYIEVGYRSKQSVTDTFVKYCSIKSSGDSNESFYSANQNPNEIIISSSSKNLFNVNMIKDNPIYEIKNNGFVQLTGRDYFPLKGLKQNTKYTFSHTGVFGDGCLGARYEVRQNKVKIADSGVVNNNHFTFTTPDEVDNLDFVIWCSTDQTTSNMIGCGVDNIQLEEGEFKSDFEYHRNDFKTVIIPDSMNGFNGVGSSLDEYIDNTYTIIQNTKRIRFNGSINEGWTLSNYPLSDKCILFGIVLNNGIHNSEVICDKFKSIISYNNDEEHIYYSSIHDGIYVYVDKSKLETLNVDGFRKFLQNEPIDVVYKLSEPIVHKLDETRSLDTFNSYTCINTSDTLVKPKITCKVPVILNKYISSIIQENSNLNNKVTKEEEINKKQNINITNNLLATTENFELILSIMDGMGGSLMNIVKKTYYTSKTAIADVYVTLILEGLKTIDDVPLIIRDEVIKKLTEAGYPV